MIFSFLSLWRGFFILKGVLVSAVVEGLLIVGFRLIKLFLGARNCGQALVDGFRNSS